MVHRTMQGKIIDLEKLANQNELMPAVGNCKVNARGDELGPGGKIVRRREDIVAAYYENNPNAASNKTPMPQTVTEVKQEMPVEPVVTKPTKKSHQGE